MDTSRIADLERRVKADPASIAFAQLAEEYRRAGRLDEATDVCRAGLARHPDYVSARVTLGRTLVELGRAEEAIPEFAHVLAIAPDNLAAIRGMAEAEHRQGRAAAALGYFRRARALAQNDPELDEIIGTLAAAVPAMGEPAQAAGLSFDQASRELIEGAARVSARAPRVDFDAVLESLGWQPGPETTVTAETRLPPAAAATTAPTSNAGDVESIGDAADPLARLEADLRRVEQWGARAGRPPAGRPVQIVAALERWLAAIERRREAIDARF